MALAAVGEIHRLARMNVARKRAGGEGSVMQYLENRRKLMKAMKTKPGRGWRIGNDWLWRPLVAVAACEIPCDQKNWRNGYVAANAMARGELQYGSCQQ